MKRNYEKFITDMIRYASSAESPDYIIQQIIKYICENLDSDRAYIFEDNLDGTFRNTYEWCRDCLLYTSPSPRDTERSRMPSSA